MRRQLLLSGVLSVALLGGCRGDASEVFGTWVATTMIVIPPGSQTGVDLLQAGSSLSISIDAENRTIGSLIIPAGVGGVGPLSASMVGTARVTSTTVEFDQAADTFVRDLTWTRGNMTLTVSSQTVGGATWNIVLSRI